MVIRPVEARFAFSFITPETFFPGSAFTEVSAEPDDLGEGVGSAKESALPERNAVLSTVSTDFTSTWPVEETDIFWRGESSESASKLTENSWFCCVSKTVFLEEAFAEAKTNLLQKPWSHESASLETLTVLESNLAVQKSASVVLAAERSEESLSASNGTMNGSAFCWP
jgi:hypothetical protein